MPIERRTRIWLGVGSWLLASTSAVGLGVAGAAAIETGPKAGAHGVQQLAQAQQGGEKGEGGEKGHSHAPAAAKPQSSQGGEGGEGGEGSEGGPLAGADEHQAFIARLLLIRGHLFVGKELYDAKRPDDALPHYLHPVEELYGDIEPEFTEHKKPGFKKELQALSDAVKTKKPAADVAKLQKAVLAKIDAAAGLIPAKERTSAAFVAHVAVLMLKSATDEYGEAIEDGRIANSVEYQDSRGFVTAGKAYLQRNEKALRAKDSQAYDDILKSFADLGKAYPAVLPPEKPRISMGEFQAAASRVELQASRFH